MSSSVTCHLARGDGSRWIVTSYRRDPHGAVVCAVRELGADAAGDPRSGPGARRPDALWRTRLEEGDRLEWRGDDGRVVAASRADPDPEETPGGGP